MLYLFSFLLFLFAELSSSFDVGFFLSPPRKNSESRTCVGVLGVGVGSWKIGISGARNCLKVYRCASYILPCPLLSALGYAVKQNFPTFGPRIRIRWVLSFIRFLRLPHTGCFGSDAEFSIHQGPNCYIKICFQPPPFFLLTVSFGIIWAGKRGEWWRQWNKLGNQFWLVYFLRGAWVFAYPVRDWTAKGYWEGILKFWIHLNLFCVEVGWQHKAGSHWSNIACCYITKQ